LLGICSSDLAPGGSNVSIIIGIDIHINMIPDMDMDIGIDIHIHITP
jgi:hypothetical protein